MLENLLMSFVVARSIATQWKPIPVYNITPVFASDNHVTYVKSARLPVNENSVKKLRGKGESLGVDLNAASAILVDANTGDILWAKEPDKKVPIASITKLMTAAVFFQNNPGWEKTEALDAVENSMGGAKFSVGNDTELTLIDMLFVTLGGSANNTALALAHATGLPDEEFSESMNARAKELGMADSLFDEPTGLSEKNLSTAQDLAKLALHVFSFDEARRATTITEHRLRTIQGEERVVKGTNKLLKTFINEHPYRILASKTGYTEEAGFCLIQMTEHEDGRKLLAVVLGSESETERNDDMKKLTFWGFENYQY